MTEIGAVTSEPRGDLERRLREASMTGQLVDLSEAEEPEVDASLLVELLTTVPKTGVRRGVRLRGAEITAMLDLEAAVLVCPLRLESCKFAAPIRLMEAQGPAVRFIGCQLRSLDAAQ